MKVLLRAAIFFLVVLALPPAASAQPVYYSIATGGPSGAYNPMGEALVDVIKAHSDGLTGSVEVTNGSIENIKLVAAGKATIGFTTSDHALEAVQGKGAFDSPLPIRVIAFVYPRPAQSGEASWNILVTREAESPATIYKITKAMYEGRKEWGAKRSEAHGLALANQAPSTIPLMFHAGALRYYNEVSATPPAQAASSGNKPATPPSSSATGSVTATQPKVIPPAKDGRTVTSSETATNAKGTEYVRTRYSDGSQAISPPGKESLNRCVEIREKAGPRSRYPDGSAGIHYTYKNICPQRISVTIVFATDYEKWQSAGLHLRSGESGNFTHRVKGQGSFHFIACDFEDSVCQTAADLWGSRLRGQPLSSSPEDAFEIAKKDTDPATMQRIVKKVETANSCVSLSSNRETYTNSCPQPVGITTIYRTSGDTAWFVQTTSKAAGNSSTQSMLPGNAYNRVNFRDIEVLACHEVNSACEGARTEIWDKCKSVSGCDAPAILERHGVSARKLM